MTVISLVLLSKNMEKRMPPEFGIDDENRRAMAALRATGLTLVEIGRQLGVHPKRVARVLKKVQVKQGMNPITCIECHAIIDSPAVQRCDAGETLCLQCLARCPDAPFGRRLRALRLAAGLTRGQLAGRAAMSETTVGTYERGQGFPGRSTLQALVRVLGSELTAPVMTPV
jgi:DNA-binding XRE family transcriptional regulator